MQSITSRARSKDMINASQVRNPRKWGAWQKSGAIGTMGTARLRETATPAPEPVRSVAMRDSLSIVVNDANAGYTVSCPRCGYIGDVYKDDGNRRKWLFHCFGYELPHIAAYSSRASAIVAMCDAYDSRGD